MISKTEVVWRHLIVMALDQGRRRSSLTELSQQLALPASTINKALARPGQIGAIHGTALCLRVLDPKRLLLLWAARRDLVRDVTYRTHAELPIRRIEELLPETVIPTAYSAFVQQRGRNTVADYDQVVVYASGEELERVFPPRRGYPNLVVLEADPLLATYGRCAPMAQVYADFFNLPTWQAQRFLDVLNRQLLLSEAGDSAGGAGLRQGGRDPVQVAPLTRSAAGADGGDVPAAGGDGHPEQAGSQPAAEAAGSGPRVGPNAR